MSNPNFKKSIDAASHIIGKTWPLYSFVTSNPLAGYENLPFATAVKKAHKHLDARMYPQASVYRKAWEQREINTQDIELLLKENGFSKSPEYYLEVMEGQKDINEDNPSHQLDRIMAKWLAAFMDEGLAEWEMPRKEEGFFTAWRALAAFDNELNIAHTREIPKSSEETLALVLKDYVEEEYEIIFTQHLAALPGWTGYINYRTASGSRWQQECPIQLEDYLAVRLFTAHKLEISLHQEQQNIEVSDPEEILPHLWLQAWEKSWQKNLQETLSHENIEVQAAKTKEETPAAQMVFCIDTRSELIRRNVENKGNYETFGYAGFFGIAMDYKNLEDGLTRKSCPPIVGSAYTVQEAPMAGNEQKVHAHRTTTNQKQFFQYFLKRMKNMLPSAFGYVEGSGIFYGMMALIRTLVPGPAYRLKKKQTNAYESICEPELNHTDDLDGFGDTIPLDEKVGIVKSAFDLMGWKTFAPLVLFVGHGSHSANNPFGSSLDCGACAASPGKHNARMLAKLANLPEVRAQLAAVHHIHIPENTVFIGAQHNTTTDEIELFEYHIPSTHQAQLDQLKKDLQKAQQTATQERLGTPTNSVKIAHKKANHWGETRPEWGLAKNAGFIIAPRSLTKNVNLDSRCFLHSYDWRQDKEGKALEGIMQGPMVVTQWINNHYYFSTVDNNTYGGGSKVTHNITGKFGVVQGNGGDLKMGLPLQSVNQTDELNYHKALRLSVLIQAPLQNVSQILINNSQLKNLLDNEWIYLMVMDPKQNDEVFTYRKNMKWESDQKQRATIIEPKATEQAETTPVLEEMTL